MRLCILLIFLCLTSCALFSKAREENLRKVQIGQSQAEVIEAIGEPSEKSEPGNSEQWLYEITSGDQKSSYPYTADFENGKLVRWYFDSARVGHSTQSSGRGKRAKGVPPDGP